MALEGNFADMPLIDLMHVFHHGRKTGRLLIANAPFKAMLWFFDGAIINAGVVTQNAHERISCGEQAVFDMLAWDDAQFVFLPPNPQESVSVQIQRSIDWLIIEGLRRRDQPQRLAGTTKLQPTSRLRLVPMLRQASDITLTIEDWRILSQLVQELSVAELVEATGWNYDQTLKVLHRLIALNLVEVCSEIVVSQRSLSPVLMAPNPEHMVENRVRGLVQAIKARLRRTSASA